ncbi:uncharacterized protein [Antedon mediterranea]|uniref:uncharacterized protein isoform X2 n=1 Tax=Antedon mediterranea TaxID=105859 RepID=UPI003AF54ED2
MLLHILFLLSVSAHLSESVYANPSCSRSINVDEQEFGVIYEYIKLGETSCSYDFRAKEGQRTMLAISHIGLLPTNSNDACVPKITMADDTETDMVICNAEDAKSKRFVSTARTARVNFQGPADSDGILLIQFWFVNDVSLLTSPTTAAPTEVPRRRFLELDCPDWGEDLDIDTCSCVDLDEGTIPYLEPPYCVTPTELIVTRCLREENRVRQQVARDRYFLEGVDFPPSCDQQGHYNKLQCGHSTRNPCKCVDRISGLDTDFLPPMCELSAALATSMPPTPAAPTCNLYRCYDFCPIGHMTDVTTGCPTCSCKELQSLTMETCSDASTRIANEIDQRQNLAVKTSPYPWIPECSDDGNYTERQCNHEAGCFCVDQESGFPSGKKNPNCVTYKECVTKRITALFRVLKDAGYRRTGKRVRGLLTGNDANNMHILMGMLSEVEYNIISNSATHIPSCNAYGDYEAVQFIPAEGTCWCVDLQGDAIAGSESSSVYPDCSMYSRQGSPMPGSTDEKRQYSVQLNESISFYCDLQNISESDDMHIFWTQNGVPIDSFNDERYTVQDILYPTTATSWLNIDRVVEEDNGSYRCEVADTSHDYFYKAEPKTLTVYAGKHACLINACNVYCSLGYRTTENGCRICECLQPYEFQKFTALYQMQHETIVLFRNNPRCEAERQNIKKKLLEFDLSYLGATVNVDNEAIPKCDADGNYELVQNLPRSGTICVDKNSGLPTGRLVPDCNNQPTSVPYKNCRLHLFMEDKLTLHFLS